MSEGGVAAAAAAAVRRLFCLLLAPPLEHCPGLLGNHCCVTIGHWSPG